MSKNGLTYDDNYFNGWVTAGIFISIVGMLFMANEISSSPDDEIIFEIMIAFDSLVIIGAVSILMGMVKLGAILIIIGGFAMIPIGMIASIGGFKILQAIENNKHRAKYPDKPSKTSTTETGATLDQQLIDTQKPAMTDKETTEEPLLELKAEHYGPMLPMGLIMSFAGFVVMLLGLAHGGTLLGFGVLNIALAFVANNSRARLFKDHIEFKFSFSEWRSITYDDVIKVGASNDQDMKLEYFFCDKNKVAVFTRSLWGENSVKRIYEVISERVESDKLDIIANKKHTPIIATIISIEKNKEEGKKEQTPYQIHTRWKDPNTGETHLFKSENIWFDPTEYIEGNSITVFVDLRNPSNHRVDISFLPDSP